MRESIFSPLVYDSIPVSLRTTTGPVHIRWSCQLCFAEPLLVDQVVSSMRWHPGDTRTFDVNSSVAVQVIYTGPVLSCPGMKHCVIWNLRKLEYQNIVHGWAFPRVLGIGPVLRGSFNYFRST